ncbi:leucine carboxyl methyltransferase [Astrocystis sublimbata]|nr:leucine carboxyl methyltransferase [Astrocystis sublimbata]
MSDRDMPAPSIPNLLTLKGSRAGHWGRGRAQGQIPPDLEWRPDYDRIVQTTDDDAAVSRLSAVNRGLLRDPFAQYFAPNPSITRLPIINRGTYLRITAIDKVVAAFLNATHGQHRQIVSLGAGSDTRPFRLLHTDQPSSLSYHEIDFPKVASKKRHIIESVPALSAVLRHDALPPGIRYFSHGVDLRSLTAQPPPLHMAFDGLCSGLPTLLISEMCLCYLEVADAAKVIDYFKVRIAQLNIVLYEPVQPNDAFGQRMIDNLAVRKIKLPTLKEYPTCHTQVDRLRAAGFSQQKSQNIRSVWDTWIDDDEKERVEQQEMLDELEEWNILAEHYAVTWGWTRGGIPLNF